MSAWGLTHPWDANDPNRPCFTCGGPPTGRFQDGSPRYPGHYHPPIYLPQGWQPVRGIVLVHTLSRADQERVEACAQRLRQDSLAIHAKGARDEWGITGDLSAFRKASASELCFSRLIGLPWRCRTGWHRQPDVGRYQVRSATPGWPYLKVRERDPNATPIVLMVGEPPTYRLAGWLERTGQGKQPEYAGRSDLVKPGLPVPDYMVPVNMLKDPRTLPELAATITAARDQPDTEAPTT